MVKSCFVEKDDWDELYVGFTSSKVYFSFSIFLSFKYFITNQIKKKNNTIKNTVMKKLGVNRILNTGLKYEGKASFKFKDVITPPALFVIWSVV